MGTQITRRFLLLAVLCMAVLLPARAQAQESIVTGLLTRAKNALNDLKYSEADSIARLVLVLGDIVPRPQRINALQIAAAARYPEERQQRRADSALEALRAMVNLGHTDPIPFDIGWVGLDSLYASVGGSLRPTGAQPGAGDASGASLAETVAWLQERVPQFTGAAWRDSSDVALATAFERLTLVEFRACTIRYKVEHREDEIWFQERNRKSTFKWDSTFVFDARYLEPSTFQTGSTDVSVRLFGVLRGATRSQVAFMRVSERPMPGKAPRRLDWGIASVAQANRVRNALERLITLCQREPF